MKCYVVLLRGVNVGGTNSVSMSTLKSYLEEQGFSGVRTYINSGNIIVNSDEDVFTIQDTVEHIIKRNFSIDSDLIKVLALSYGDLVSVIENKPKNFGDQPNLYHSDVIFLMGIDVHRAYEIFSPRDGVDRIWAGKKVIYSQRLSSERTKSRLNKIMSSPLYKSMTIRNWNTVQKITALAEEIHQLSDRSKTS